MTMEEIDRLRDICNAALERHRVAKRTIIPVNTEVTAGLYRDARFHVEQALLQWWAQDCKEVAPPPTQEWPRHGSFQADAAQKVLEGAWAEVARREAERADKAEALLAKIKVVLLGD